MNLSATTTLFIVAGRPAAGKSTYGAELAQQRRAALIDLDTFSEPVVKAGLTLAHQDPDDRDSKLYKETFRQPVYDAMFDVTAANIRVLDVVLVAPFTLELKQADWPEMLARTFNCKVEIHFVYCKEATRFARMTARNNPRDAAKLSAWSLNQRQYEETFPECTHRKICSE